MEAQTLFFGVLSTQFQYEGREVPLHQQAVLETPAGCLQLSSILKTELEQKQKGFKGETKL